jgi:hypothetical protein
MTIGMRESQAIRAVFHRVANVPGRAALGREQKRASDRKFIFLLMRKQPRRRGGMGIALLQK